MKLQCDLLKTKEQSRRELDLLEKSNNISIHGTSATHYRVESTQTLAVDLTETQQICGYFESIAELS